MIVLTSWYVPCILWLQIKNFKDYIDLYIKGKVDDQGTPLKLCHEIISDRWEVGVTLSEKGFQQASFVNSIATTKVRRNNPGPSFNIKKKRLSGVAYLSNLGYFLEPYWNSVWLLG